MRHFRLATALSAAIGMALFTMAAHASFVYRGSLQDAGRPAEGAYDMELTLYSARQGGRVLAGPLSMHAVPVRGGSFSVATDFGELADAPEAWLAVRVRPAGDGDFVALNARAPVAPMLATTAASSVCPGAWTLDGNAGNVAGMYLGTADAQPLTLKTNATAAMTIGVEGTSIAQPAFSGRSIVIGAASNVVAPGVVAAFVAGGGDGLENNVGAGGDFATIAGGGQNTVAGLFGTVGGGYWNSAAGQGAVVPGGQNNRANAETSFAAGSYAIVRSPADAGNANGDIGTFVWSDSTGAGANTFGSSGPNQFLLRSGGGVGVNRTPLNPDIEMTVTASATGTNATVDLALLPKNSTWGYDIAVSGTGESDDSFGIWKTNGASFTKYLGVNATGDLSVHGTHAYKNGTLAWEAPSDLRIKRDVAAIAGAIDTLLRLQPVSFRYSEAFRASEAGLPDRTYLGFVAQDFAKVFPDAVNSTGKPLPGAPDAAPILALDPSPALITTVAAVRELAVAQREARGEVDRLRDENAELRARLDTLLEHVQRLERATGQ